MFDPLPDGFYPEQQYAEQKDGWDDHWSYDAEHPKD